MFCNDLAWHLHMQKIKLIGSCWISTLWETCDKPLYSMPFPSVFVPHWGTNQSHLFPNSLNYLLITDFHWLNSAPSNKINHLRNDQFDSLKSLPKKLHRNFIPFGENITVNIWQSHRLVSFICSSFSPVYFFTLQQ